VGLSRIHPGGVSVDRAFFPSVRGTILPLHWGERPVDWTVLQQFLEVLLGYPTLPYTVMLGLALLYWLTVIVGAADLDLFSSHVDGMLDGHPQLEADVGVDAHAELDAHADLDAPVEGDAGLDGHHDAEVDGHDHDADHGVGGHVSALGLLLQALHVGTVPITITASFLLLYGWMLSVGFVRWLGWSGPLLGTVALCLSFVGAVPLTSVTVRPFGTLFATKQGLRAKELVGQTCTVSTMRVDGKVGQAEWLSEGTSLLLQVRCDRLDNQLKKGSQALLVHYDEGRNAYIVEPMQITAKAATTAGAAARRKTSTET
jgi:hypothetical protein